MARQSRSAQALEICRRAAGRVLAALAGAGACLLAGISAGLAQSKNVGEVADSLTKQTGEIGDLLGAAAFVIGIGFIMFGLLKMYAYSKNPNDPSAKVSTAAVLLLAGAAMVAIPTTTGVGIGTLFGEGAKTATADGSELRTLK
ncbi:MAG: hypothetical protein OXE86_12650 [Alphaproteobacteria bacterium]|nr:hypothetical protein [Alphaproteobacteria bacterium]